MSSDVVLSAALRNNLLSLQNTQRSIDTTQLRLATGKKVNSALDNAQSFFAAQALNNRASDLGRLLDGISQSVRTIEEADKGITALTRLIEQAESIATEAQGEARAAAGFAVVRGTKDLRDIADLTASGAITANDDLRVSYYDEDAGLVGANINIDAGDSVYNIVAEINAAAAINDYVKASVDANGHLKIESKVEGGLVRIGDGTTSPGSDGFAYLGLDNIVGTEQTVATTRQAGTAVSGRTIRSAESAVTGGFAASDTLLDSGFLDGASDGDTVDITLTVDGASSAVITIADTATIQELLDGINNDETLQDAGVVASFNTDTGRIEIKVGDGVGQLELTVGESSVDGFGASLGFGTTATDDVDVDTGDNFSEIFTFAGNSADLARLERDFNSIRQQIDALVEDANYRGVNLLNGGSLTTFFNEDRTNSLVTEGVDFTSVGLGITEADYTTGADVEESLSAVRNALISVRDFGSSVANDLAVIQTRRDFTEGTITTLKAGADDFTLADQNEEGANLLALQTRQQLGITSLALASQSQQAVLRLF